MKNPFIQNICPEYHFDFGALGVQRAVPALPGGEQNFYGQEYFAEYGRIAGAFANRLQSGLRIGQNLPLQFTLPTDFHRGAIFVSTKV